MEKKLPWITVLLVGSVWGFFEATLGGLLHFSPTPIAGRVMAPIAFAILYLGMKNDLKARHIFCASLIAAAFKGLDPFLFHMPFLSNGILNPVLHNRVIYPVFAIVTQGLGFAVVSSPLRKVSQSFSKTALWAIPVYPLSLLAFCLISIFVFHRQPKALSEGMLGLVSYTALRTGLTIVMISLARMWVQRAWYLDFSLLSLPVRLGATAGFAVLATVAKVVLV